MLKPVAASPFAERTLSEAHGGLSVCKPVDEALRPCGISWRAWGRAAPVTTILVDGLPDVAAARAAVLATVDVVGTASAFTPGRQAILEQLSLLVMASGAARGAAGSAPIANVGFVANACNEPGAADAAAGALAAVLAIGASGSAPAQRSWNFSRQAAA